MESSILHWRLALGSGTWRCERVLGRAPLHDKAVVARQLPIFVYFFCWPHLYFSRHVLSLERVTASTRLLPTCAVGEPHGLLNVFAGL